MSKKIFKGKGLIQHVVLFLMLIGASSVIAQPMNGNYTINSAAATSGTNYQTFTAFANALASRGVNGPVVATVDPSSGPYTEQVNFGTINGMNATNTVTINGNNRTLQFNATSTSSMWTLRLNGTDYMTINNLNVVSQNATYHWGIVLANAANYNTINGCTISCPNATSTTSTYSGAIILSNSTTSPNTGGNSANYNTFSNNYIKGNASGGYYWGIVAYGPSTSAPLLGNKFLYNIIENIYVYGTYIYYSKDMLFEGNIIRRPTRNQFTTYYGVNMTYCDNIIFKSNTITKSWEQNKNTTNTFYVALLQYCQGDSTHIENNAFFDNGHEGQTYGLYNYYPSTRIVNIYHNVFNHSSGSGGNTKYWYYMYNMEYSYGCDFRIQNNIFDFNNTSGTVYTYNYFYGATWKITNNIYNFTGNIPTAYYAYLGNSSTATAYTSYGALTLAGYNAGGLNAAPNYANFAAGDLTLTGGQAGTGVAVGSTADIRRYPRSGCRPNIGAFEAPGAIEITSIKLPSANDCELNTVSVEVTIKNNGGTTFSCPYVQYHRNNEAPVVEMYNGTIAPGASVTYTFTKKLVHDIVGASTITGRIGGANTGGATFNVSVKGAPNGFDLVESTPFEGKFTSGSMSDPDIVANPDRISYELKPAPGYPSASFGSTWLISTLDFKYLGGGAVPSTDTVGKLPGATNGNLLFTPSKATQDSIIKLKVVLYSITTGCTSQPVERYILSAPRPDADFTFNVACGGSETQFSNTTILTSGYASYEWDFGDGVTSDYTFPSHLYSTNGSYTVRLIATSDLGYSDTVTKQVSVFDVPTPNFIFTNSCEGGSATFANQTTSPNAGTITASWDFGDGSGVSGQNTPSHTYSAPGVYMVKMTATDGVGCIVEKVKYVTHFANPVASFTVASGNIICTGSAANFINSSNNGNNPVGYEWDFGDGSTFISLNGKHEYAAPGSYDVKLTARNENGCKSEEVRNINVIDGVKLAFSTSGNCKGSTVSFTNSSVEPGSGTTSYNWEFGDGGISADKAPTHTYNGTGKYRVKVTGLTSAGCVSETETEVIVGEKPIASFSASSTKVCTGENIDFTNGSFISDNSLDYTWNFGDGNTSTDKDASNTYTTAGNYNVTLVVSSPTSGCTDSVTRSVVANATPNATFTVESNLEGNGTLKFTPQESSGSGTYLWLLGDGAKSTSKTQFTHQYPPTGTFTACLQRNNDGCQSMTCEQVVVYAAGVSNVSGIRFSVYPNPSSGKFTISSDLGVTHATIRVMNLLGEVVYSVSDINITSTGYDINMDQMSAGVYMVKLSSGSEEFTQKVTIVK